MHVISKHIKNVEQKQQRYLVTLFSRMCGMLGKMVLKILLFNVSLEWRERLEILFQTDRIYWGMITSRTVSPALLCLIFRGLTECDF